MHYIVVGLGFGDEGKGTIVDTLAAKHEHDRPVVIRHNGGSQAAHNVVTPEGKHHTFAQFGSGTFVPTCRTHLSHFVYVNPLNLVMENKHLREVGVTDSLDRLTIAENAKIITPFHQSANRAREQARTVKHGTCGEGVGEATSDYLNDPSMAIVASDLLSKETMLKKLEHWREVKRLHIQELGVDAPEEFDDPDLIETIIEVWEFVANRVQIVSDMQPMLHLMNNDTVIFEGAQGVLLDEWRGFHPYTTWSTTTDSNARSLIGMLDVPVTSYGVIRTYGTRHGAGPFPSEDRQVRIPELHNDGNGFQGRWRRGLLDLVLLRYAIKVCDQIDALAVTHCDKSAGWAVQSYTFGDSIAPGPYRDLAYQERLTHQLNEAIRVTTCRATLREITERTGAQVGITSGGPTRGSKSFYPWPRK